jgi:hypothetical protein
MDLKYRQLRIFVLPSEPNENWVENVVGRVISPVVRAAAPSWYWFSRYGENRVDSSVDCNFGEIPPEYEHKMAGSEGLWRSVRFRVAIRASDLTDFEGRTLELLNQHNYSASGFIDYLWIDDLAAERILAEPRTQERKVVRAKLVAAYLHAASEVFIDALREPDDNGQFRQEKNESYSFGCGSSLEPLRHLFVNMTNAPTQIFFSEDTGQRRLLPHILGEPQIIFSQQSSQRSH